MSDQPTPILCPECGHDIDAHPDMWTGCMESCDCGLMPSDIARALLTAEPTEAEVEATAEALYGEITYNRVAEWGDVQDGQTGENFRELATTVLRAARQARR